MKFDASMLIGSEAEKSSSWFAAQEERIGFVRFDRFVARSILKPRYSLYQIRLAVGNRKCFEAGARLIPGNYLRDLGRSGPGPAQNITKNKFTNLFN